MGIRTVVMDNRRWTFAAQSGFSRLFRENSGWAVWLFDK
jgi:hypothetical protein